MSLRRVMSWRRREKSRSKRWRRWRRRKKRKRRRDDDVEEE